MSEAEWLACGDPAAMLSRVGGAASDRKLRLFSCACCHRAWGAVTDGRLGRALDALERYTPLLTLVEPAYHSDLALQAAYDRMQALSIDDAVLVGAAQDGALAMAPVEVGWRPVEDEVG